MGKSLLQIVAVAPPVLALYYWTLFVQPVALESFATGPDSLSVEQSRELLEQSRTLLRARDFADARDITLPPARGLPANHIYLDQLAIDLAASSATPAPRRTSGRSICWSRRRRSTPARASGRPTRRPAAPPRRSMRSSAASPSSRRSPTRCSGSPRSYERAGRHRRGGGDLRARGRGVARLPRPAIGLGRVHLRQGQLEQRPARRRRGARALARRTSTGSSWPGSCTAPRATSPRRSACSRRGRFASARLFGAGARGRQEEAIDVLGQRSSALGGVTPCVSSCPWRRSRPSPRSGLPGDASTPRP